MLKNMQINVIVGIYIFHYYFHVYLPKDLYIFYKFYFAFYEDNAHVH